MKKVISSLILLLVLVSCNKPNLNGHYHLEWGKDSNYQIWNIKNNSMKINEQVCSEIDTTCFLSSILFKGDSIFVFPYDHFIFEEKYQVGRNGTINIGNNNSEQIKLTPKTNCINTDNYLNNKIKKVSNNFNLVSIYYTNHGESVFPNESKNELIIGKKDGFPFYILNNEVLKISNNTFSLKNPIKEKDIWIHIDNKVKLKEVLIILKELIEKDYKIYFTSKDKSNYEKIIIFKKSILEIIQKDNLTTINTCEYCEKHPTKKIDSVLNFKIFGKDSCLVNNEITDFYQLRKYTARFMGQNRSTRLKTQIQLEINSDILFENYFELLSDIEFLNKELSDITYYHGKDDPDQKEILDKQNSLQPNQLHLEFPLRIKEIIKPF